MSLGSDVSYDPVTRQMERVEPPKEDMDAKLAQLTIKPFRAKKAMNSKKSTSKVDDVKLHEFLRAGRSQRWIGEYFGVTQQTIQKRVAAIKRDLAQEASAVAPQIIAREIRTADQLCKINQTANALLDNLYYEEEVEVRDEKTGVSRKVKRIALRDPQLALRTMAEIRNQLKFQLEIFSALTDVKAVKEFQDTVLDVINSVEPALRDAVVRALQKKNALRSALEFR